MTDTTDVAALHALCKSAADCGYVHPVSVDGRLLESLLSQLDVSSKSEWKLAGDLVDAHNLLGSERQRADAKDNAISLATEIARKASDKIERIEAELAALNSAHGNVVTRCALLRQRPDLPVDRIPAYNSLVKAQEEVKELRKKLTNPVVLPAGYSTRAGHPFHEGERNVMIPNKDGDWLSRFDVEHAIHFAGFPFTNKDGD